MSCFLWKINGGARGEQICKVGLQVIFIKYVSTPKVLTQLNPVYTRAARVPPHPQAFSVIPSLLLVLVPKINLGEKKKAASVWRRQLQSQLTALSHGHCYHAKGTRRFVTDAAAMVLHIWYLTADRILP